MWRFQDLANKVGKGLGEYFLGIETYKFYNNREELIRQAYLNDIKTCNNTQEYLKFKKSEDIFSVKIVPTILSLFGFLTIFSNSYLTSEPLTSSESIKCTLVGLTTILLSEGFRLCNSSHLRRNRRETREIIENCCNEKP